VGVGVGRFDTDKQAFISGELVVYITVKVVDIAVRGKVDRCPYCGSRSGFEVEADLKHHVKARCRTCLYPLWIPRETAIEIGLIAKYEPEGAVLGLLEKAERRRASLLKE